MIRLPECVYLFVVIPAKAGIQESNDAVVNRRQPRRPALCRDARIKAVRLPVCVYQFAVIPAQARLHGCRAFGELSGSAELTEDRAVVERRREQAAEVVSIPLLWRGARQGGVVGVEPQQVILV